MYCFWLLFLLLIAVDHIQTVPNQHPEFQQNNVREFSTIQYEAQKFKCGKPQKRAYTAVEIVEFYHPESFNADEIIIPPMVVLHRCDQRSGCCFGNNFTCAPKKMENVHLVLKKGDGKPLKVKVNNHTECHCVSKSSLY